MSRVLSTLFKIHQDITVSVKKPIFSEPETFRLVQIARNSKSRSSIFSLTEGTYYGKPTILAIQPSFNRTTHESLIRDYRIQNTGNNNSHPPPMKRQKSFHLAPNIHPN